MYTLSTVSIIVKKDILLLLLLAINYWECILMWGNAEADSHYLFNEKYEMHFSSALKCPSLSAPPNGKMEGADFIYGSTVTFSCFRGFTLVGSQMRKCQNEGIWSGRAAECRGISISCIFLFGGYISHDNWMV